MKSISIICLGATLVLTGCESSHRTSRSASRYPTPTPPVATRADTPPPVRPPHRYPQSEPWVDISITTQEREVIQGYMAAQVREDQPMRKGKNPKSLPPGLQKKLARGGTLPPGWEKKFHKGEVVPVKVYEQCHRLPHDVLVKLPPQPSGTVLITVGGKVARVIAATREILDVFEVTL